MFEFGCPFVDPTRECSAQTGSMSRQGKVGKYHSLSLTSESLPPRPASLFRREAGAGRLAQLEGALLTNGVDR